MMKMSQILNVMLIVAFASSANAIELLDYLTDKDGKYVGPTVEEKIAEMDTDNNGFADVYEVRAYLAKKHGDDYQQAVLSRWEANANPNSCGATSFTEAFVAKQ